jgi:hypothetical protein
MTRTCFWDYLIYDQIKLKGNGQLPFGRVKFDMFE